MTEDLPSIIIALLAIFFAVRYFYPSQLITRPFLETDSMTDRLINLHRY
jgi:hypothetical protein